MLISLGTLIVSISLGSGLFLLGSIVSLIYTNRQKDTNFTEYIPAV